MYLHLYDNSSQIIHNYNDQLLLFEKLNVLVETIFLIFSFFMTNAHFKNANKINFWLSHHEVVD